jgi:two-component system nitrogen regulation sensor histidine kinase NtrY
VARRIAHEIKNPLTPIQLSAERLKRKYLNQIRNDPEVFAICTDTIIRHAGVIGRMVDEFSSFARMPAPTMSEENLGDLVEQAVFLQQTAHSDIRFTRELPDHPVIAACDGQQIGRALTNLLQNAVEAIRARAANGAAPAAPGQIQVRLVDQHKARAIVVEDNGCGLPKGERHRLTEPYVTSREGGTGLGLAIVKKIMEDHGGDLLLEDRREGGARVRLVLPLAEDQSAGTPSHPPPARRKASAHGA